MSAQPLCYSIDYTATGTATIPSVVRPTCDGFTFSTTITNNNEACEVVYQIDLRFITTEKTLGQPIPPLFNDMVYAGSIPVFSTSTGNVSGDIFFNMSFRVTVPAGSSLTFTLPFTTTAIDFTPNYGWTAQLFVNSLEASGSLSHPLFDVVTLELTNLIVWDAIAFGISGSANISDILAIYPFPGQDLIVYPATGSSAAPTLTIDVPFIQGIPTSRNRILMSPGSTIKVMGTGALTLINSDVQAGLCSSQLIQGIVVETGGTLVTRGCTLNDSRFAIDAKPGSTISVSNTGFFDNYIGLRLDMSSAPEASKRVAILALGGNTFATAQSAINAPFPGMPEAVEARGYCGIMLNDYRDFNIFGSTGNAFSALANGIIVSKSTLNLNNMSFNDMNSVGTAAYPLEGFGIYLAGKGPRPYWAHINEMWWTMTFNNCKTGIYANRYSAQVDNTIMTNVTTGIDWTQSPKGEIRLRSNNISARRFGIRSFQNEPLAPLSAISANTVVVTTPGGGLAPVTGIEMQESGLGGNISGWRVLGNSVTMNTGGRGILYRNGVGGAIDANSITNLAMPNNYTGILTEADLFANVSRNTINQSAAIGLGAANGIFSASGTANTYQCNCIDNTHVGAQFYDMADFTNAVRGNNFNTHTTGLQLGNAGIGDVFIGRQNRTGNIWDLSQIPIGEFGGVNWGGNFNVIFQSRFNVPGVMGSNIQHPNVDPGSDWFFPSSGSSFTCSNACVFPAAPGIPDRVTETHLPSDLDYAIATGTLSNNPDITWKGNYRLYRKMLRQPALENYAPVYANFKSAQTNLPSGKLAYIAEERAELFAFSPADQSTDDNFRSSIAVQTADLRLRDSLLQAGVSINMTQYNTLVQQKATNEANYTTFLQSKATARQQQIQSLLTLNAGISASTVMVTNHQTLNNIALNLLANDEGQPSAANLTVLTAIAGQCPITGGDAVYEARAIVERFTGETFDDAVLCASGSRPSNGRTTSSAFSEGQVQIFPNPSTGQISWTGLEGEALTLRVFNALGQQVAERNSAVNGADLSNLPAGVYHLQFLSSDNTLRLNKSVVIEK